MCGPVGVGNGVGRYVCVCGGWWGGGSLSISKCRVEGVLEVIETSVCLAVLLA